MVLNIRAKPLFLFIACNSAGRVKSVLADISFIWSILFTYEKIRIVDKYVLGVITKTRRLDQTSAGHNEDTSLHSLGKNSGYFAFICLFFVVPSLPSPPRSEVKLEAKKF